MGVQAGQRTVARLAPRKAPTGSFHLVGAAVGKRSYRPFAGRNQRWCAIPKGNVSARQCGAASATRLAIAARTPLLPRSLGAAYFDGDGVATRDNCFVATVFCRAMYCQSIRRANWVYKLRRTQAVYTIFLCTARRLVRLNYSKKWVLTLHLRADGPRRKWRYGDYFCGAAGYWVENGEIVYPVDEFTIAGNLRDMLKEIVAMGDDVDLRGNIRAPVCYWRP